MSKPQVIRTVEELEELDVDTRLITRSGLCRSARWFNAVLGNEIGYTFLLPVVVIATAEQVRAARKALEEENIVKVNIDLNEVTLEHLSRMFVQISKMKVEFDND